MTQRPGDTSEQDPDGWRQLRVTRIVTESSVIRSLYLEPADDAPLVQALAGQHLPIRLTPASGAPLLRTYTLSNAPNDRQYRLSVRRLGAASQFLHDQVAVGDTIAARAPAGNFTIDAGAPGRAVLIAAGVGITPMLAMLAHLVIDGERTGRPRPATLFYATRSRAERAFDAELAALAARAAGAVKLVRLLQSVDDATAGVDYEAVGTITSALFEQHLGFGRHDFLLCGPPPFMQAVYAMLRDAGVADQHIHAEAFGPASLVRDTAPTRVQAATGPVEVSFGAAGPTRSWTPGAGSLLEFAEASGLTPEFGCRAGACGACKTRILAGEVAYIRDTSAEHADDEVLLCSAVPAAPAPGKAAALTLAIV